MRQSLPCAARSGGVHLTAGAFPPNSGLSLALSQFLSGLTHTSASNASMLQALSSNMQTPLLSPTDGQASLQHVSGFVRIVRYLHRGLSHSDCGLVP